MNICDTRIADEDEVVIQAFNHGSVHHAAFLNETEVFALSHDEKFALYDIAEGVERGCATLDLGDVRQVLGCQYVANVYSKLNGAGAVVGAGSQEYVCPFMLSYVGRLLILWLTATARRCSSCFTYRRVHQGGVWIRGQLLGCLGRMARSLSGAFASLTKNKSCLQREKMAISRRGYQSFKKGYWNKQHPTYTRVDFYIHQLWEMKASRCCYVLSRPGPLKIGFGEL